ncbi:MAG: hypothetical protein LBT41_04140, partial [Candidatus Methanoplasma sp.]|nr:hypothetical protein [Candidatus Methanoplasma sp.]
FNPVSFIGGAAAKSDGEDAQWVRRNIPGLKEYETGRPGSSDLIGRCGSADIAIGFTAGMYTGAPSVIDLAADEGLFGYYGVRRLMEMLEQSAAHPEDIDSMAEKGGLKIRW